MTKLAIKARHLHVLDQLAESTQTTYELMVCESKAQSIRVFKGQADAVNYSHERVAGIRVVNADHNEGYAYTERLDEASLREAFWEAFENAKICSAPYPVTLRLSPPVVKPVKMYSRALDNVSLDELTQAALKLERDAYAQDKRIINVTYAMLGKHSHAVRIYNSLGLDVYERSNSVYGYLGVLAGDDTLKRSAGAYRCSRNFKTLDTADMVREATQEALSLLDIAPRPEAPAYATLFAPEAFADLLDAFSGQFSAKNNLEGRSLFTNKKGQKIAASHFSLIDSPRDKKALNAQNFDAEGFPSQKLDLIRDGKLKNFLHNSVTASYMHARNNGRAARSPKSTLSIARTNWIVQSTHTLPYSALMLCADTIIHVVAIEGLHSGINPVSGDFSIVGHGYVVQSGQRLHALKPFTLSGNILTLLKDIIALGDDCRICSNNIMTPSLLVNNLSIN